MFLSDKELAAFLSISRATVWRWTAERNSFPKPHALSPGCKRWKKAEVDDWLEELSSANRSVG
ncbi:AlpA family transcriptional regulator [uncultured Pelagimonas sp.]|uniref:helix-turn-helix transcriptional regulator n=1 Tax=uncultured Pelagimonas sp. TaxID=1618102 RepID=UPI00261048C5|nr:AlpA family phage regulatory protein [uncultured Pelagimonas sp.]